MINDKHGSFASGEKEIYMFSFEKLEVWQNTMDMSVEIYRLTTLFPKTEQFLLTDQIRRAISAVPANIAEGNSRNTGKDTAHFLSIAYSSLMETMNHLILAQKLGYIDEQFLQDFRLKTEKAAAQISALRNFHTQNH